jgi:hypothetical protein
VSWHAAHGVHTRAVAIVARHGVAPLAAADILVVAVPSTRGEDDEYHVPGTSVASGEHAELTLRRSIRQQFGFDVVGLHLLGTLSNTLAGLGETADEVTWVYACTAADPEVYLHSEIPAAGTVTALVAVWMPVAEFITAPADLLPDGALRLILAHRQR